MNGTRANLYMMQVQGYPGMFRVIAWVLNGLMLDVQNATLHTSDDGIVTNKFWLTGTAQEPDIGIALVNV